MRWPWQPRTDRLVVSDRTIDRIERVADKLDRTADDFRRELAKLTRIATEQRGVDHDRRAPGPRAVG